MMKTLMRIGLILLAFGIVAGGWYLVGNSTGSGQGVSPDRPGGFPAGQSGFPGGQGGFPGGTERPQLNQSAGAVPEGSARPERSGGGAGEPGGGMGGIALQLGKVVLITAAVAGIQWFVDKVAPSA